jgi:hypothetical protein
LSAHKARDVTVELDRLKSSILTDVATADPDEALDLLWLWIDLHPGLIERCYEPTHHPPDLFRVACRDLGPLAMRTTRPRANLSEQVYARVIDNPYGLLDDLIEVMAEALGDVGLEALKALLVTERKSYRGQYRPEGPGGELRPPAIDGIHLASYRRRLPGRRRCLYAGPRGA